MKVKPFDIFLTVFILALIFLFNFIAFDGAKNVAVVINTKSRAVELQATITSSEHYTDSDADGYETDRWEEKVSYTYNGTEYRDVLYDSSSGSSRLGKVVTVKIDPNNPDELLPDAFNFLLSAVSRKTCKD